MDFGFSEDQEQLRTTVREYFAREFPVSFARTLMDDARAFPLEAWHGLAELGWIGLAVPESLGGSGLGLLDLSLVLESAGAVAFPGPFVSTVALALPLVLATGDDVQRGSIIPEVVGGKRRIAAAVAERRGRWSADAIEATARREGGSFVLDGAKMFVPDAGDADTIVAALRLDDGIGYFALPADLPGLRIEPMRTVDQTRRLFVVTLEGARVEAACLLGGRACDAALLDAVIDGAKVATAALMVGSADRALAMTVDYTGLREQFGRAIATFQVVQHRCADMKVAVEHARSLVYYAAWAADTDASDRRLAAAMAKAFASDACPNVAADAVQLHGGIGFTWEHDLHIFFKRLKADEQTYGDATANRELVARFLEEA
jgi:alkylation response protein AidB-like acyl-CoA dehydrogenase